MSTLSLRLKYRPIRIGWCVRGDDLNAVRRVLRLTHTLWGGRYNPLIPVGDLTFARDLVNIFRVDALYPASDDPLVHDFIGKFPYLPWPDIHEEFFIDGFNGKMATFLDIYHPVRHLHEEHVKDLPSPKISTMLFEWDTTDPLSDIFLSNFGSYPPHDEIGKDYSKLVEKLLSARKVALSIHDPVPAETFNIITPSVITGYQLLRDRSPVWDYHGLYVGNATDFTDIVNFWNLRAADIDLIFYDTAYAERLNPLKDAYLVALREKLSTQSEWRSRVAVWTKSHKDVVDGALFGSEPITRCAATTDIWNGLNIKPSLMHFEEQSVLASFDDKSSSGFSISFQLPDKPFYDDVQFHTQHVVVSVHPFIDISGHEELTLKAPFIPELNEYYGRECHFIWNEARSEVDGLGIITEVTRDHLTLRALSTQQLIEKIFEAFGMKAEPSPAGLIGSRLIQQMDGIQGCRVFKIAGIRNLIEKYSPLQSFTRSAAIQTIGQNDPSTGKPNFTPYESLYIEARKGGKLKPEDAFIFLVKNGVFRVGVEFNCPNCNLDFWLSIDDIATEVICEYCGKNFNVIPQLRDRDWRYRRSGLFGREDHQEGGIPVALTLQQLDTILRMNFIVYVTGLNIKPLTNTSAVNPCEVDFTVVTQSHDGRVQIAVGECKGHKEISDQDVENLKRVAETFPRERFDAFIIFSKTDEFTPEEIDRCRKA